MDKPSPELICEYSTKSKSYHAFMMYNYRQLSKQKDSLEKASPGILTSLYLDAFLLFKQKICSTNVVRLGLCKEGKFTVWRSEQRALGNLDWDTEHCGSNHIIYHYRAGAKILKYLKNVADEHGLVASIGYVNHQINEKNAATVKYVNQQLNEVRSETEELKERLAIAESVLEKIVQIVNPPVTPEKIGNLKANPELYLVPFQQS